MQATTTTMTDGTGRLRRRRLACTALCLSAALLPAAHAFAPAGPSSIGRLCDNRIADHDVPCFCPARRGSPPAIHARGSTHLSARGINFAGDSTSAVFVPHPPVPSTGQPNPQRTLTAYLRSTASDGVLLGTSNYARREGTELYEAYQPEIDWFGLRLVPVFVNQIDRPADTQEVVYVDIREARTDIAGGRPPGNRARAIADIMKRSEFSGRYELLWESASGLRAAAAQQRDGGEENDGQGGGWKLNADLTLVLSVPLPKLVPLPPGFNTVGSRIVRSTCRKRVEDQLRQLRQAYIEWARQEGEPSES